MKADGPVSVRYIVDDVDASIAFYEKRVGFRVEMHPAPTFAILSLDGFRLMLSGREGPGGGSRELTDGRSPEPGGWNRIQIPVADLDTVVARLRNESVRFRSDVIEGVGARQVILDDPSGNPVELYERGET